MFTNKSSPPITFTIVSVLGTNDGDDIYGQHPQNRFVTNGGKNNFLLLPHYFYCYAIWAAQPLLVGSILVQVDGWHHFSFSSAFLPPPHPPRLCACTCVPIKVKIELPALVVSMVLSPPIGVYIRMYVCMYACIAIKVIAVVAVAVAVVVAVSSEVFFEWYCLVKLFDGCYSRNGRLVIEILSYYLCVWYVWQ